MSSFPERQPNRPELPHHRQQSGTRPGDEGFTLVEVLVATVVMTIGLVGIAALLALTTEMHFGAREAARSTRLAQDKFDELMKLNFSAPEVAIGGDLDANETDYYDQPTTGVTVRWAVAAGPTDDTRIVTVRVVNEKARKYRRTDLSTIIRQW